MKSLKCTSCYQIIKDCLCFSLPKIESTVPFVVVQHWKEQYRASNTGRLIHLSIQPSFCFFNQNQEQIEQLTSFLENYTPYLVFPSEKAILLDKISPKNTPHPICFVILDGTWRQAVRMRKRIQAIASLPCIQVNPTTPSIYQLRKQKHPFHLSTVEAAILLMKESGCADPTLLEALFHKLIQQSLKSRGKIKSGSRIRREEEEDRVSNL